MFGKMTLEAAIALVLGATQLWKEDPGSIYEDEQVLYALSLCWRFHPPTRERAKKAIKQAKITQRDVIDRLPEVRLAEEDAEDRSGKSERAERLNVHRLAGEMLTECPVPQMAVPAPYSLTDYATLRSGLDPEDPSRLRELAPAPLLLTGALEDIATGEVYCTVAFRYPKQGWRSIVVGRDELLSTRGVARLARRDFPASDYSAKGIVQYFHYLDGANRGRVPRAATTSQMGWQGRGGERGYLAGAYITPEGEVIEHAAVDHQRPETWSEQLISFRGADAGDEQIAQAFYQNGTLDEWRATAGKLRGYPKALIGLYAAFAPVLLRVIGCKNFIINWADDTSVGKSTVLRAAGSVWGNPDERAPHSVLRTWRNSLVSFERGAALMNDLPFLVDDTKQVRKPEMVPEVIYMVAGGRGAGRGSLAGQASTATFRTVMLTNGEQDINSIAGVHHGGAQMRVLEIGGKPFGARTAELDAFAQDLNRDFTTHFGHAGPLFVAWLLKNQDTWPAWRERYRSMVTRYSGMPPIPGAGRIAEYAALIVIAGEMAHRALALPWEFYDPLAHVWAELSRVAKDAGGPRAALRAVVSWAYAHESGFIKLTPRAEMVGEQYRRPSAPVQEHGRWDRAVDEDWRYLAFYEGSLKRVLKEEGHSFDAVMKSWLSAGWLRHKHGERVAEVKIGPNKQDKTRMVCILRSAIEEVLPTDPETPEPLEEVLWPDDDHVPPIAECESVDSGWIAGE